MFQPIRKNICNYLFFGEKMPIWGLRLRVDKTVKLDIETENLTRQCRG